MHQKEEATTARVDRYLLFVGCPGTYECEGHIHPDGWDTLAAACNDLDEMRKACLTVPEHLWWHVVDLTSMRVIMRSTSAEGLTAH